MADSPLTDSRSPVERSDSRDVAAEPKFDLVELATGRLYLDGEPEVRLRSSADFAEAVYLMVITIMSDGHQPIGLTASVFYARTPLAPQDSLSLENAVKEDITQRVLSSRGEVVAQFVRFISRPVNLASLLVREMLDASNRLEDMTQP
jgi:hypothetical protein